MSLGRPAREQKNLSLGELMAVIIRLCTVLGWLTRHALAELLGRSGSNLQTRTLAAMVTENRLKMRYPAKNHPSQAYSAV